MNKALDWMVFAKEDVELAHFALKREILNQACFHSQQGVEKALKAYIRAHQHSVPKTHSLKELLEICRKTDGSFKRFEDVCSRLDDYYIPTRYPDALPGMAPEGLPTLADAQEAVQILDELLGWIDNKIC